MAISPRPDATTPHPTQWPPTLPDVHVYVHTRQEAESSAFRCLPSEQTFGSPPGFLPVPHLPNQLATKCQFLSLSSLPVPVHTTTVASHWSSHSRLLIGLPVLLSTTSQPSSCSNHPGWDIRSSCFPVWRLLRLMVALLAEPKFAV